MKLYHGTSVAAARLIDKEGLRAADLIPNHLKGYVYLTYQRDMAETYGEVIYEVESNDLDQSKLDTYQEGIGLIHNYYGDIPITLIKKV